MKTKNYLANWLLSIALCALIIAEPPQMKPIQAEEVTSSCPCELITNAGESALVEVAFAEAEEPRVSAPEVDLWNVDALSDDACCGSETKLFNLAECGGHFPDRWQVRVDAIFFDRSAVDGAQSIAFGDPADPVGTEVLNTSDLDFASAWGPRISLIRCRDEFHSLEIGYFGIDNWNSRATRSGNISVQFPTLVHPPSPPGPFGTASFDYSSQLDNFEVNLRRVHCSEWLTWIIGFRYVELAEEYGAIFNTGGGTSRYTIDANNFMYGVQFGGEANIWQHNRWSVDGWLKAALMSNSANQTTFEDYAAIGGGTANVTARSNEAAFLGEIGLGLVYELAPRLAVRAGYQLMWLDRLALAPEQLNNSMPAIPLATVDMNGDLFLHGGFVGLEALF